MTTAHATEHGYALALEEARRTLDEQERTVIELRSRAGTLVSAAAIVTSFLGAPALARNEVDPAAWVATAAFVALTLVTLRILWPRYEWEFSIQPENVIGNYVESTRHDPLTWSLVQRDVALHMGASAQRNRDKITSLTTAFRIASAFLAIEIVAWGVSIIVSA